MRRLLTFAVTVTAGLTALVASASALDTDHIRLSFSSVGDFPAGTVCDFTLHEEGTVERNVTRFRDKDGTLLRTIREDQFQLVHQNLDTGYALTEVYHQSATTDFITGVVTTHGVQWLVRDESGRVVFVGGGLVAFDFGTGEIIRETPGASFDFATTVCPLLGGAPA